MGSCGFNGCLTEEGKEVGEIVLNSPRPESARSEIVCSSLKEDLEQKSEEDTD